MTGGSGPCSFGPKPTLRVLVGCHIAMMGAVSPIFAATFGLYLPPMAKALGWARSEVALGLSVFLLVCALVTPLVGVVIDRFGSRVVTLASAFLLPGAIVLFALAPPWRLGYLAAAALLGVAGSLSLPLTYVAILNDWFEERLGRAIALAASGLGTGAILNPFIASHLIGSFGWRSAWIYLAIWGGLLALAGRSLVPWPSRRTAVATATEGPHFDRSIARSLLSDQTFWRLTTAFMLVQIVTLGVFSNVASAMHDRGASANEIALTAAAMGVSSLLGRLCGGMLLDWISVRWVGSVTFALQGVGCVLLAFTRVPALCVLAAALASVAVGVEADMIPFSIRRRYEPHFFGRIFGLMYGAVQIGGVIGPVAVAFAFDRLGAYTLPFAVLAGLSLAASFLMLIAYGKSLPGDRLHSGAGAG